MNKDSTAYTLIAAVVLCLVCSVIVSTAAVQLRPLQEANKLQDKKSNILQVVGLLQPGVSVDEAFKQVEARVVNLATGEYDDSVDAATFDQREAASDPARSTKLAKADDIAGIGSRANLASVYIVRNEDGGVKNVIIPVHGYGLWSTLYGFLALEGDGNTVVGLSFYDHAETPGLGGEVDNPKWKALWPGKVAYTDEGAAALTLVKGGIDQSKPSAKHYVDALSGATLTSTGVSNLLHFWLGDNGFRSYLQHVQAGRG